MSTTSITTTILLAANAVALLCLCAALWHASKTIGDKGEDE